MPLEVHLRGMLEPEIVDEDFHAALNVLNNTSARGQAFTVMDTPDGNHVMVHILNITKIKEVDD
jgi:hypothetical protein